MISYCTEIQEYTPELHIFKNFNTNCYFSYFLVIVFKIIIKLCLFFIVLFLLHFSIDLIKKILIPGQYDNLEKNLEKVNLGSMELKDSKSLTLHVNQIFDTSENKKIIIIFVISTLLLMMVKYFHSNDLIEITIQQENELLNYLYPNILNIYEDLGITLCKLTKRYNSIFLKLHSNIQKLITNIVLTILLFAIFASLPFIKLTQGIEESKQQEMPTLIDCCIFLTPFIYHVFLMCQSFFFFKYFEKNLSHKKISNSNLIKDYNIIKQEVSANISIKSLSTVFIIIFIVMQFSLVNTNNKLPAQKPFFTQNANSFVLTFIVCTLLSDQKIFNFDNNAIQFSKYLQLFYGLNKIITNIKLIKYSSNKTLLINNNDEIYINNLDYHTHIWAQNKFKLVEFGKLKDLKFKNIIISENFKSFANYIFGLSQTIPSDSVFIDKQDLSKFNLINYVMYIDRNFSFFYQNKSILENLLVMFPHLSQEIIENKIKKYFNNTDINLPYCYLSHEEKEMSSLAVSILNTEEKYFLITNSIKIFNLLQNIPIKICLIENFSKLNKDLKKNECYEWFCKTLNKIEEIQ